MRRRTAFALAAAAVALGLWATFRAARPRPEPFALDDSLPAGAVRRIGSRMFGRVGGPNRGLVELSPDGRRVYVLDDDGLLRAWDVDRGAPLWQVAAHRDAVPPPHDDIERRFEQAWRAWTGAWHAPPLDIAVSPDGRRIATCAAAMIRVFDTETGRCLAERRTEHDVDDVAWTPDGRRLVRADHDRIAAWDVDEDEETRSESLANAYLAFATRTDGRIAARAETQPPGAGVLLDGTTLARTGEIAAPPKEWLPTLQFDDEGRELACRWPTKERRRWSWAWHDPSSGTLSAPFETDGFVARVLEPERGRQLVVIGGPRTLDLVRLADGDATHVAGGPHTTRIAGGGYETAFASFARGRRLAWAALGRARIHDLATGRLHADELLVDSRHILVPPDGARFLTPSEDGAVVEIGIDTGRVLRRFDVGAQVQQAWFLSPDGRCVAGWSTHGAWRLDLGTGAVERWNRHPNHLSFRGERLIGIRFTDRRICVVDVAAGDEVPLEGSDGSGLSNARFSDDGTRFTGGVTSGVHVWDTVTGRIVDERLPVPLRPGLADSPGVGGTVLVGLGLPVTLGDPLDPNAADPVGLVEGDALGTHLVAVPQNPVGAHARETREARIVLVSADDGRTVATLTASDGPVRALAFVPGGRRLLSGHDDGTILVWDLTALPAR